VSGLFGPRIWAGPDDTPAVAHYYRAASSWIYTPGAHLCPGETFVPGCEARPEGSPVGIYLDKCYAVDWHIAPEPPVEPDEIDVLRDRVAELEQENAKLRAENIMLSAARWEEVRARRHAEGMLEKELE
jgi:hypothetical protein